MKIIRRHLDTNMTKETLFDDSQEHGLIEIEIGTMRFAIRGKPDDPYSSEKPGIYINFTDTKGYDQLIVTPHAANAVTLGSGRYEKETA